MAAESVGHGSRPVGHGDQVHGEQGTWQLGTVKLMAGCNSMGVTSVSLPVVNSYVSKTCDKGVKGRRMLLCRGELCDRDECIKADFNDLYKDCC